MLRTKPFGRVIEPYSAADDYFAEKPARCDCCDAVIPEGDKAFYVCGDYFCMECKEEAADALFAFCGSYDVERAVEEVTH